MDIILDDIKISINNLSVSLELYSDRILYFGFDGHNPDEYKNVIDFITELNKLYEKFSTPKTLSGRIEFYEKLELIRHKMKHILSVFEEFNEHIDMSANSSSSSSSSRKNIFNLLDEAWIKLRQERIHYVNILKQNREELIAYLSEGLEKEFDKIIKDSPANINYYNALFYNYILSQVSKTRNINAELEIIKNKILCKNDCEKSESKIKNTIQSTIQRARLVPVLPSGPLKDLLEFIQPGVKTLKDLCKLKSNKYRFGYIILHKYLPKPHEANLWTLTNVKYLNKNKLLTDEKSGINDKLIERFKTIRPLPEPTKDGFIEIYNDLFKNDNYYYVFETLNGIDYRLMKSDFYLPGYPYVVPEFDINDLPQKRISAYHKIMEDKIIEHVGAPIISVMESYSSMYKKAMNIKWDIFRRRIKDSLVEWWETKGAPKDEKEFFSRITSKNILEVLSESIITAMSLQDVATISKLDEVHHTELQLSYTADLSSLLVRFGQLIEETYNRDYKENLLSRKASAKTYLKIFESLLNDIIPILINRKSNIYQQLMHKADILIKTI